MEPYTDLQIITAIRSGGAKRDQMAMYLLKHWRGYGHQLGKKYSLTLAQQKDVYTDAIVKLITQIDQGKFKGNSQLSTYFFSILNNACVDVLRKLTSNKNKPTEPLHEWTAIELKAFDLIGRRDLLQNIRYVIEQMGQNCQDVLMDWGFSGYSMAEIAKRRGLASAESARSIKYKCLKKLKVLLGTAKK